MSYTTFDLMRADSEAQKAAGFDVARLTSDLASAQAKLAAFDARRAGRIATVDSNNERAELAARVSTLTSELEAAEAITRGGLGYAIRFDDSD